MKTLQQCIDDAKKRFSTTRLTNEVAGEAMAQAVGEMYRAEQNQKAAIHCQTTRIEKMGLGDSIYQQAYPLAEGFQQTDCYERLCQIFNGGKRVAVLCGATGTGKTYAAVAWCSTRSDFPKFVTAYDLSYALMKRKEDILSKLERCTTLVIDDLGTEPTGFRGDDFVAHFLNLFNTRYTHNRLTVITTNLKAEQLKTTYGDRFVSRLRDCGSVYEVVGQDMRGAN